MSAKLRGRQITTVCSLHGEQIVDSLDGDVITLMCDCKWDFSGFPGIFLAVEPSSKREFERTDDSYRAVPERRLR